MVETTWVCVHGKMSHVCSVLSDWDQVGLRVGVGTRGMASNVKLVPLVFGHLGGQRVEEGGR